MFGEITRVISLSFRLFEINKKSLYAYHGIWNDSVRKVQFPIKEKKY